MTAILVDSVVKATLVLAVVLALDVGLRRISAADRHLMWTVAAALILLLPLVSASVPSVRWPAVPVAWAGAPTASVDDGWDETVRALPPDGGTGEGVVEETIVLDTRAGSSSEGSVVGVGDARGSEAATDPGAGVSDLPWWVLIWAIGAGTVLLGLLLQSARRVRLERSARPFGPGRVRRVTRDVAGDLGLQGRPVLLRGEAGVMPSTWGLSRRRLLLPESAASWQDERLRSVLAHELAHLRRHDGAAQLIAAAACVIYWFHPLAWLAARRMASERELACDDEVLRLGTPPGGYARCLVELARETRSPPLAGAVATSMGRRAGLDRRVDSVLSRGRPRSTLTGRRAGLFGVAGLLLLLPVASLQLLGSAPSPEPAPDPVSADGTAFRPPLSAGTASEQEAAPCWAPDVSHSMNVHHSDDEHLLRWEGEGCVSEIRVRGIPSFDEDFDAVTGLSEMLPSRALFGFIILYHGFWFSLLYRKVRAYRELYRARFPNGRPERRQPDRQGRSRRR
jgi:beta-lactamase regulating signal transducer with metallopeptidase domain